MQYKKILSNLFLSLLLILSFSNFVHANTALENKVDILLSKINDENTKNIFINNMVSKIEAIISKKGISEKNKTVLVSLKNYLQSKLSNNEDANSQIGDEEYSLGVDAQNSGDYDKAIEYYETVLSKNPNHGEALNNLGMVYFTLKDYDEAIKYYDKAVSLYPEFYVALNNEGVAYYMLGDYDNAKVYINKALSLKKSGIYYYNLGLVYKDEGDFDKAVENYKKAYDTKENLVFTYDLAGEYYNNGYYDEAIKYYSELISYKNDYQINSLLNTGNSYYYLGNTKKAGEFFDKILKIDPTNEDALYNKSMLK